MAACLQKAACVSSLSPSVRQSSCSAKCGNSRASSHAFQRRQQSSANLHASSVSSFFAPKSLSTFLLPVQSPPDSRNGSAGFVSRSGARAMAASGKRVLIVQTSSGGHAIIGFYLAKALQDEGHSVTIMTVGEESSDKMKKEPFSRYDELRNMGVETFWGNPADVAAVTRGLAPFNVVVDNNGKDLDTVKPVADYARQTRADQFLYVSSAGIYKPTDEVPHVEGDPVKEDAGHKQVENYLANLGLPDGAAFFRPQYITGSGNNKDCEEWFFERIVRGRPVCIPGSGMQMTVISHASDLASMMVAAVGHPRAKNQVFNCVGERAVTFDGLVRLCAKAAGKDLKEVKIVHYDPKKVGVDAKKAFPFRNMHFYSEPRAAKELLGWSSKDDLAKTLERRFKDYKIAGRHLKPVKFPIDDTILVAAK